MFSIRSMTEELFTNEFRQQAAALIPTLFTHPESEESTSMRSKLTQHGIPFLERSVVDQETADELAKSGAFMTPLLFMGDQRYTFTAG